MKKTYRMLVYSPDNLSRSAFVSNLEKRDQFSVTQCAKKSKLNALVMEYSYDYVLLDMVTGRKDDDLIGMIRSSLSSKTYIILATSRLITLQEELKYRILNTLHCFHIIQSSENIDEKIKKDIALGKKILCQKKTVKDKEVTATYILHGRHYKNRQYFSQEIIDRGNIDQIESLFETKKAMGVNLHDMVTIDDNTYHERMLNIVISLDMIIPDFHYLLFRKPFDRTVYDTIIKTCR